jgi:hypothetical protein
MLMADFPYGGEKYTVTVKNFLPVPVLCIEKYCEMRKTATIFSF